MFSLESVGSLIADCRVGLSRTDEAALILRTAGSNREFFNSGFLEKDKLLISFFNETKIYFQPILLLNTFFTMFILFLTW